MPLIVQQVWIYGIWYMGHGISPPVHGSTEGEVGEKRKDSESETTSVRTPSKLLGLVL
jgi:hypothetical protein